VHLAIMAMAAPAPCYLDAKVQQNAGVRNPITPSARSQAHYTRIHGRSFAVAKPVARMRRGLERSIMITRTEFVPRRGSPGAAVQRRQQTHLTPAASLIEETNSGFSKVVA
jgi:hypothetical protein